MFQERVSASHTSHISMYFILIIIVVNIIELWVIFENNRIIRLFHHS